MAGGQGIPRQDAHPQFRRRTAEGAAGIHRPSNGALRGLRSAGEQGRKESDPPAGEGSQLQPPHAGAAGADLFSAAAPAGSGDRICHLPSGRGYRGDQPEKQHLCLCSSRKRRYPAARGREEHPSGPFRRSIPRSAAADAVDGSAPELEQAELGKALRGISEPVRGRGELSGQQYVFAAFAGVLCEPAGLPELDILARRGNASVVGGSAEAAHG